MRRDKAGVNLGQVLHKLTGLQPEAHGSGYPRDFGEGSLDHHQCSKVDCPNIKARCFPLVKINTHLNTYSCSQLTTEKDLRQKQVLSFTEYESFGEQVSNTPNIAVAKGKELVGAER